MLNKSRSLTSINDENFDKLNMENNERTKKLNLINKKTVVIKNISFNNNQFRSFIECLNKCLNVKDIKIINCKLNIIQLKILIKNLLNKKLLISLNLDNNNFGCEGAIELAQFISKSKIIKISLKNCGIGEIGGLAIANSLQKNFYTVDINLAGNELGASSLYEFYLITKSNKAISFINLTPADKENLISTPQKASKEICKKIIINIKNNKIYINNKVELLKIHNHNNLQYLNCLDLNVIQINCIILNCLKLNFEQQTSLKSCYQKYINENIFNIKLVFNFSDLFSDDIWQLIANYLSIDDIKWNDCKIENSNIFLR